MTEIIDWTIEAETAKAHLALIERAANEALIPPETIAELKRAVDHCRTALWAAATAASSADNATTAAILAARLSRVQEMCERIVDEVAAGRVWAGTPGLGRFVATLGATEQNVRSLLNESAAAGGR